MLKSIWKSLQRGIDMNFFLFQNTIPDETEYYFTIYYGENIKD